MSFRIRVFDSRIHAMSLPGGMIYRWAYQVTEEVLERAIVTCPVAHQDFGYNHVIGRLKASHTMNVTGNGVGVFGSVGNTAPYARFVHDGTRDEITPTSSTFLKFSIDGKKYRRRFVAGQRSQPWLSKAQVRVLARHQIF